MSSLLRIGFLALVLAGSGAAAPVFAAAPLSEISIKPDGAFSATNVVVMQKAGSNLFARVTWGNVFLRLTILTTPAGASAVITKNNGGAAAVEDIKEGDILAVKGTLAPGADTLLVNAASIRDLSLNKELKSLSGVVKSVDYSGSFILPDKKLGNVKVLVGPDTVITKGVRTVALGEVAAGERVLSVSGSYDFEAKILSADTMSVQQNKAVFYPKNFEGKLKNISTITLPASLMVTVGKQDYTVFLPATASVMSKNKAATTLQRFTVGDTVRFYGAIRQTNLFEIDAEIIRNLAF